MKPSVLISFILLFTSCHREELDIPIDADFSYEVIDNDYSIPVKIAFFNKSTGAQTYTRCHGSCLTNHPNENQVLGNCSLSKY